MIYAGWYFCYQIRLSADETDRYLDALFLLQEQSASLEDRTKVLRYLKNTDLVLRAYAIPVLTQALYQADKKDDSSGSKVKMDEYLRCLEHVIINLVPKNNATWFNAIGNLRASEYGKLIELLKEVIKQKEDVKSPEIMFDYLEMDSCIEEILILSFLRVIAENFPEQVSDMVRGENQISLIKDALNGKYGQLPWNLSIEILNFCHEPEFTLMSFFPKNWFTRPDLMELSCNIKYRREDERVINEIFKETFQFEYLREYFHGSKDCTENFWISGYCGNDDFIKACAVMWQAVLWMHAMQIDAEKTIQELRKLWIIPDYVRDKNMIPFKLNYVQQKFPPAYARIENQEAAQIYVECPWIRHYEMKKADTGKKDFRKYGSFSYNGMALRVFTAIPIMKSILLNRENIDSEFVCMLFHWGDVLSCNGAKNVFRNMNSIYDISTDYAWGQPVRLLGYHVNHMLTQIGMGKVNSCVPTRMVDILENYASAMAFENVSEQMQYLFSSGAYIVSAHWAVLSLGESWADELWTNNVWFKNGENSNAAELCRLISLKDRNVVENMNALQLVYETFPQYLERVPHDWVERYQEISEAPILSSDLVASEVLSYDEWRELGSIQMSRFQGDADKVALTMRLQSALSKEKVTLNHPWLQQWIERLAELQQHSDFSLLSRFEMLNLIKSEPAYVESYDSLYDMCVYLIHAINEFTTIDSIYYLTLLMKHLLTGSVKFGEKSLDSLRMKMVEEMWDLLRQKEKSISVDEKEATCMLLNYFIMHIENSIIKKNRDIRLNAFLKDRLAKQTELRLKKTEDIWQLKKQSCYMWQKSDNCIRLVEMAASIGKAKFGRPQIVNLFEEKEEVHNGYQYVGVIVGKSYSDKNVAENQVTYLINYGEGENVEFSTDKKYFNEGQTVFVELKDGNVKALMSGAFVPMEDEVAEGTYKISADRIEVTVFAEKQTERSDENFFNQWNADLSQIVSQNNSVIEGTCLVEWHNENWVPVIRDFSQLIMEQILDYSNPEHKVTLILIQKNQEREKTEWLFSSGIGFNYRLYNENLDIKCREELEKRTEAVDGAGLIVKMKLVKNHRGIPVLSLDGEMSFDDKNIRWKERFAEEDVFVITKGDGGGWYVNSGVPEIADKIMVEVEGEKGDVRRSNLWQLNVQLKGNWDIVGQRRAKVKVEQIKTRRLSNSVDYEQLQKILEMKPGDIFDLSYVGCDKAFRGYYNASLTSEVAVKCAVESISSKREVDRAKTSLYRKRRCIVEYVDKLEKKEGNPQPCFVEQLEMFRGSIRGIIADIPNERWVSEEREIVIGVCLELDGRIGFANVPVSAFSQQPMLIGEPILAERKFEGWVFQVQPRAVYVRALWDIYNHKTEGEVLVSGIPLGVVDISGMGSGMAVQDEDKPVIHLIKSGTQFAEYDSKAFDGIAQLKSKVSWVAYRKCGTKIFKNTFYTSIVKAYINATEFWGEARSECDFEKTTDWRIAIEINRVRPSEEGICYDLRRKFIPMYNGSEVSLQNGSEQKKEQLKQYQEWCSTGDYHAVGTWRASKDEKVIQLHDLSVPVLADRVSESGQWTREVLMKDEDPWVLGRSYSESNVRVKLQIENNKWVASHQNANTMLLDDSFANYFDAFYGKEVEQVLYYAGLDENDKMRFEWGFGYRFVAKTEDVTDPAGNLMMQELFFGDKILKFHLDRGGDCGWKMIISPDDIIHELEFRVIRDAQQGVIQLLEVRKSSDGKQVSVQQVSVAAREIGATGWALETMKAAKLDEESIQKILEEENTDGNFYILAKLTLTSLEKRNSITFSYIPFSQQARLDEELKGKVLCLVAGSIIDMESSRKGKVANNCRIEFFLPNELPPKMEEEESRKTIQNGRRGEHEDLHLKVVVTRRRFSLDESKLRVLKNTDQNIYYRRNMMVRLTERFADSIIWDGNVVTIPPRPGRCLKEWVKGKKTCLVTMGSLSQDNMVPIEISPGILSRISRKNVLGKYEKGALASLKLVDDMVFAEMILPGDISYITGKRPVEFLIMDGALNEYFDEEKRNKQGSEFTVAGFPQLMIRDTDFLDQEVIKKPPHLAYLSKIGMVLKILPNEVVHAGFLQIDIETQQPAIRKISPEPMQLKTSWNLISFCDGTVSQVVSHVRRGRWHYHDKKTGVLNRENKSTEVVAWPEKNGPRGCVYDSIPLFLGKGDILRYSQNELCQFGYSAREIQQNGLPEKDGWYSVAGATNASIWIEMLPGKLIQLPSKYLFAMKNGENLSAMYTSVFAPGDEIRLDETEYSANQLTKLLIKDVRFGMRSVLGKGDAYLPIKEKLEGGLVLGGGNFTLTFPMADTSQWEVGEICRLSSDNILYKIFDQPSPSIGDTVMLYFDGKRRAISGMPKVYPSLVNEYFWGESKWLWQYLWDKENASNNLFLEGIPVQIKDIVQDEKGMRYRIIYPQPTPRDIKPGTELYCNVLGEIMQEGESKVVLRTGGYLFCVKSSELISGLPMWGCEHVIKSLAERKEGFWMHKTQEGWCSGLVSESKNGDCKIDLLFPVLRAAGILCKDDTLLKLWWLPVGQACRVNAVSTKTVYEALSVIKEKVHNAVIMDDGTVSLIHTLNSVTRYTTMKHNEVKQRIIPRVEVATKKEGIYTYLGELYPHGDIVHLMSEKRLSFGKTEPIPVDIVSMKEDEIRAIPSGTRRRKINLSEWVIEALRNSYIHGKISYEKFASCKPERYGSYDRSVLMALEDAKKILENKERAKDIIKNRIFELQKESEEVCLIYLYEFIKQKKVPKELQSYAYGFVHHHLEIWLSSTGKTIASGFDRKYCQNKIQELDLFPTIAAILLLNWIRTNEKECKLLAVHLTRMVGMLCMSSVHQEFLMNNWLLKQPSGGMWARLSTLYLGGESQDGRMEQQFDGQLCASQYQQIVNACKSIISRKDRPVELKLTAECLLYAVGAEADYRDLYFSLSGKRGNCVCSKMVTWGRCLMPGAGRMIAMDKLPDFMISIMKSAMSQMEREDSYPVSLLTDNVFPITDEEKKWAVNLCLNAL